MKFAPILLLASLLAACSTHGLPKSFPRELRAEASLRKQQCDTIERSFRPSVDQSGELRILGFRIGGRQAISNLNSVSDQHLVALNQLLLACRDWQRFKIEPREFRQAQAQMARVMRSGLDQEAAQERLKAIAEVLVELETGQDVTADEIGDRIDELNQQISVIDFEQLDQEQLYAYLAEIKGLIEERLPALQTESVGDSTATDAFGVGRSQESEADAQSPVRCIGSWVVSSEQPAYVSFDVNSASPNQLDAEELRQQINKLNGNASDYLVAIVGFADVSGDPERNLTLAMRRAEATAFLLEGTGVSVHTEASAGETDRFGADFSSNRIARVTFFERCPN